ncbi:H+/gluconate symporter and related permeases [Budvicia aquatica]|uniref:H+/gluconate symporter and related permeases n=1 Tax=Budvicia aquatica TaxID=82979 RepID=A0A484ZGI4_9GAMM|nr:H+/gluconate symporter and related permeases [Budvicia aquatica]
MAYFLAKRLVNKDSKVDPAEVISHQSGTQPGFLAAISAPLVAIALLSLRPIAGISVDPLIALPVGGLVGAICMGRVKQSNAFMTAGLARMAPVAIMLLGTGTLAGIIANSGLKEVLIDGLAASGLPPYLLAPISGAIMSMATASTTAGTAIASSVFSHTLLELGVTALAGAAMIHAGATVMDHLPHGSFFHATGGSVNMQIKERLKLLPYETIIGLTIATVSTLMFGVFGLAG